MANGATLRAPETVFFSYDTQIGRDVTIDPNVVFGPGVTIADGAHIKAFSHLEGATVGEGAQVGPVFSVPQWLSGDQLCPASRPHVEH